MSFKEVGIISCGFPLVKSMYGENQVDNQENLMYAFMKANQDFSKTLLKDEILAILGKNLSIYFYEKNKVPCEEEKDEGSLLGYAIIKNGINRKSAREEEKILKKLKIITSKFKDTYINPDHIEPSKYLNFKLVIDMIVRR